MGNQDRIDRIIATSAIASYICRNQAESPSEDGRLALTHLPILLDAQRLDFVALVSSELLQTEDGLER